MSHNPEDDKVVHTYDDDIREQDNRLPLWWQYTLYGAIVFAVFYVFGEHKIGAWKSRSEAYEQEALAARLEAARNGAKMTPETLVAMSRSQQVVGDGKQIFVTTCAACHRADGGGNIGPNLTDGFWLHGGKPENLYKTVTDGVADKGMPSWGPQLGAEKVADVVAYVMTLHGTNVPGGKPPQGDPE